jgi:hypothetical protein
LSLSVQPVGLIERGLHLVPNPGMSPSGPPSLSVQPVGRAGRQPVPKPCASSLGPLSLSLQPVGLADPGPHLTP